MADVLRFQEAISNFVLDAGEAVSYRSLASQVGGESAMRAQALAQFYEQNGSGVGAMHVAVELNASTIKTKKPLDPRARVVRLSVASEPASQVYGVYPSTLEAGKDADDAMEAMALALWARERKVRNGLFAKTSKHQPLTRELKAFYQSDVHCAEATSRSDLGDIQGEEAVTVFDSIKTSTNGRTQTAATSAKPSFFKGSASSSTSTAASSSSSSSAGKSNSFFKSSSTATSAKPKASASAVKSKAPAAAETKRIDADAMNNVLTVDSDDDSDGDDDDAPKFVKATPAAKPRASKRVMISDDEDEDDDFEEVAAPPAQKERRPSAKRKLSESPERPAKQAKAASPKRAESPKRKRDEEEQDEEPQAEEDPLPTGPIKRRELVTKTIINDMGYMVTEKVYEEVEVSVEELTKERAEAKKKQAATQAAAAAQKARATAAAASKASKTAAGPPKQKKLDFFFARK